MALSDRQQEILKNTVLEYIRVAQPVSSQLLEERSRLNISPATIRSELQVLCEIASGRTTSQIAEDLSLSKKTVSTYKRRILDKMEMTNAAQLIRYAIEHDLGQ